MLQVFWPGISYVLKYFAKYFCQELFVFSELLYNIVSYVVSLSLLLHQVHAHVNYIIAWFYYISYKIILRGVCTYVHVYI